MNQAGNTLGGWSDEDDDYDGIRGSIHLESKNWGDAPLVNGKIWQSGNIDPGKYSFTFRVARGGGDWNVYYSYMRIKWIKLVSLP